MTDLGGEIRIKIVSVMQNLCLPLTAAISRADSNVQIQFISVEPMKNNESQIVRMWVSGNRQIWHDEVKTEIPYSLAEHKWSFQ